MNLDRVEILLIALVVCGVGFVGIQFFPKSNPVALCGPVTLSPEVKAYIDNKLKTPTSTRGGDVAAVVSRVNDLQMKLGAVERYRELRDRLTVKGEHLQSAIEAQRKVQNDVLSQLRSNELGRLRSEMALMCANFSARNNDGGSSNLAQPPRGGRGRGGGGGGGGRRRRQQADQPDNSRPAPAQAPGGQSPAAQPSDLSGGKRGP